jgi:uncharacterized protein (TIGR02145 family)
MMVSTGEVTNILTNSADASGLIIDLGEGATQYGHCYAKTPDADIDYFTTKKGKPTGTGDFTSQLTNLEAGTKYYIKAYISNGTEPAYGKETNFTTLAASVPTITTTAITSVTTTTATSGGSITGNGGATVTVSGVCWSTSVNPVATGSHTTDGTATGTFTSSITGLIENTTYYVKAYATNSAGTSYGNELSFTTNAVTSTTAATSVTSTTATLNGSINANNSTTNVTFEYGTSTGYGQTATAIQSPVSGSVPLNVNADLTGLTPETLYHYRVKAVNSVGTSYGNDITFSTLATLTDIDGNVYNTVTIGTQTWMAENLKTTKYNDGTTIHNITVDATWAAANTGAYSDYSNIPANSTTYGRLYNWYAVDNNVFTRGASNGGKNVCPTSWHVPTDAEWLTLTTYLGGESVAGGKLKETGTTHWTTPNSGTTNETGFTALPFGNRTNDGIYLHIKDYGFWWSTTEYSTTTAWPRSMHYGTTYVNRYYSNKQFGFSVRCLRD